MKPIPGWSINHPFLVSSITIGGESLSRYDKKIVSEVLAVLNKHRLSKVAMLSVLVDTEIAVLKIPEFALVAL